MTESNSNLEQDHTGSDGKVNQNLFDASFGTTSANTFDWTSIKKDSDTTTSCLPKLDAPTDGDAPLDGTQLVKLEAQDAPEKQNTDVKINIETTSPYQLRNKLNNGKVIGKSGDVTELKINIGKGETSVFKVEKGADTLYFDKDNTLIAREGPLGTDDRTVFQTIRDDASKTARGALEFTKGGTLDREIRFDKDGKANGMWDGKGREIYFPRSKAPSVTYGSASGEAEKISDSYGKVQDYRRSKK